MRPMAIFSLVLALPATGYGRSAASLTEFYVDADFAGSIRDGRAATPGSSLGGSSSPSWASINSALEAGDVTIYFSARQAGSDTNETATWELYLCRTSPSSHRLTLDGISRYHANDLHP